MNSSTPENRSIKCSSPTRIDLCGGTLDLWPLHLFVDDAITINLSISIQTHCELKIHSEPWVRFISPDVQLDATFESVEAFLQEADPKWTLLQKLMAYIRPEFGFEMKTSSESPVGGGLGGSSSLTISILKAFTQAGVLQKFSSTEAMTQIAANLEASILKTPTGTQDYIPAIAGGLNIIRYSARGFQVETREVPAIFKERLLLIYTGRQHHSGINNFEVLSRAVKGDQTVLGALQDLRLVSQEFLRALDDHQWDELGPLFARELQARLKLAESFTSPEIEKIIELTQAYPGAQLKICGAGGGGCVAVWADPSDHEDILLKCKKIGCEGLSFRPVEPLS